MTPFKSIGSLLGNALAHLSLERAYAEGASGRRSLRQPDPVRQAAAQAKRERRQARNLRWAAAGGISIVTESQE